MNHVQRRLVSTAAKLTSVSPSAAVAFPPPAALRRAKGAFATDDFDADGWAHVQPVPTSALVAFANRIGLAAIFDSPEAIRQACTHPSFLTLYRQQCPSKRLPKTNAQLATIGNSLMGLFATEYIHAKYPYLPTRVLKATISAHVGPGSLDSVAREMGAAPLLRWHRSHETENTPPVLHADAMASIPRSLTALIYQERSLPAAREFVHTYFLSRQVDVRAMLKFFNPKKSLLEMVQKYGRELPKSRLLRETGRFSNSPMFVVGIFSGVDQLGEGFGASLRMAEYRAAEDALMRVYLTQTPPEDLQLPSSTFPSVQGNIYAAGPEGAYVAPQIAPSDILYASSGRSRVPVSTRS